MDVFEFREQLVVEYEQFSRSFTRLRSDDIREFVDREYASQRYWPEPLIQINPTYRSGGTVDELVAGGQLSPECSAIFRLGKSASSAGVTLPLHQHQAEAISLALAGESYVLTTGTGSGKSLSYFIPVVDACLKAKKADPTPRTRAIVIYPMNALANSQLEELKKFLGSDPATRAVSFGRYTGQESDEERRAMAATPPDILLTNFMMLELLMTRQNDIDKAVMRNAKGLRFLVLDELHTYRGRQGADVALLVRRVREALSDNLICIGTSATMASEGTQMERNAVVANVARRLFGTAIPDRNIITETLRRTTPEHETLDSVRPRLCDAIRAGVPTGLNYDAMAAHPMSVWVELTLGLTYEDDKPRRAKPRTLADAAKALSADSGEPFKTCLAYLQQFMLRAYAVTDGAGKSLFAFKLHQFIAGGGKVYMTLEAPGQRAITLDGQQFVSGDDQRQRRYYHVHFCRDCGQEYIPVWDTDGPEGRAFDVRNIEERQHDDEQVKFGFLMPDGRGLWEPDNLERYPESWLEERADGEWRIKSGQRKFVPQPAKVRPDGVVATGQGLQAWFIPGSFRFCLACGVSHSSAGKDSLRLTSLSAEGRSSATTMLTLSALRYLYEQDQQLSAEAKKVLGFSDNRQDAALQAGHFNDFLQVLLTRAALLSATQKAGGSALTEREVANAVFEALGLPRKHEHVISTPMPSRQADAYGRALAMKELSGPEGTLGMIHALRRISLHPLLLEGGVGTEELRVEDSARMMATLEVLDRVAEVGEKALVFLESLDLQDADQLPLLLKRRYGLARLPMVINGQVATEARQARVNDFQRERGFDVMLLSPKAGGVGLTLTAANHVVHLSRWWNPAVEDQCSDRVYRIGQTRPVHIYYPLAVLPDAQEYSFDVQLQQLMARKRKLAQDLLAAPAFTAEDYRELVSAARKSKA